MTEDLSVWLLEAIAEDEKVAREQRRFEQYVDGTGRMFAVSHALVGLAPHRAVAECEAKRHIIERYQQVLADSLAAGLVGDVREEYEGEVLRWLALPYADRPGYRADSWAPDGR